MRRTSMARRPGTQDNRSRRSVRLASEGAFAGAVLDAGCGTGENALHIASLGLHVLGVDVAETALSIARKNAAGRGIDADFVVADAFHLDRLDRVFETVLDCGLFHTFDRDERRDYVASLASVTGRGAHLYVLCFSDVGPDAGPHPVSQEELRAAFTRNGGWSLASVRPDRMPDQVQRAGCAGLVGDDRTDLGARCGHLSDVLNSDVRSPSGPRCVSLSGLTIPLMLVI